MRNDLENIWELIKISYKLKSSVVAAVIFMTCGILVEVLSMGKIPVSELFVFCVALYPAQLLFSFCATGIVLSSPQRKKLMLKYPLIANTLSMLIVTILICIIRVIEYYVFPENRVIICNGMFTVIAFVLILTIYSSFAYKYFIASILGFLSLYIVAYSLAVVGNYELTRALISLPAGIALSIAAVFIGAVIQYFIYKSIYKKPISKYSQSGELKKAM